MFKTFVLLVLYKHGIRAIRVFPSSQDKIICYFCESVFSSRDIMVVNSCFALTSTCANLLLVKVNSMTNS